MVMLPDYKEALGKYFKVSNDSSETAVVPLLFVIPGIFLALQTYIVAPTHMIEGTDVYAYEKFQIFGGIILILLGILLHLIRRVSKKSSI
jgi:hypothetical protein